MARNDFVKGQSIESLINMNPEKFLSLTPIQTRQVVSKLASAANKRLKRSIQSGRTPYIVKRTAEEGKFSVAGKNITQLQQEYNRVRAFLEAKETTAQGYYESARQVSRKLKEIGYKDATIKKTAKAMELYQELAEKDADLIAREERYKYLREINDLIGGERVTSADNLLTDLRYALGEIGGTDYESSLSAFFDGEGDEE